MGTLQKIKSHLAVKAVWDEGPNMEDTHNWFVSLKDGYVDVENDNCGGLAENTLAKIYYRLTHYVKSN